MDIIRGALRRPVTVLVVVLAVILGGSFTLTRVPRDIFPNLDVPVIYVAQTAAGMDGAQMEGYLTYRYEIAFLYISGIEHIESKSVPGLALIKLQFHPGTDMANAMAETINQIQRSQRYRPKGTTPPFAIRFDPGSGSLRRRPRAARQPGVLERSAVPDGASGLRRQPRASHVLVDARPFGAAPLRR